MKKKKDTENIFVIPVCLLCRIPSSLAIHASNTQGRLQGVYISPAIVSFVHGPLTHQELQIYQISLEPSRSSCRSTPSIRALCAMDITDSFTSWLTVGVMRHTAFSILTDVEKQPCHHRFLVYYLFIYLGKADLQREDQTKKKICHLLARSSDMDKGWS